jgi:hypothetical protein
MPDKPVLVVIHGMGSETADSFKATVTAALTKALNRYQGFESKSIEEYVDIKPIAYNQIFETIKGRFKEASSPFTSFLAAEPNINIDNNILNKLEDLETNISEETFVNTHIMDVLLYLTSVGEWVRLSVINELTTICNDNVGKDIHILAHSLGTAVMHDTLYKFSDSILDRFSNIWMFANVSRVINTFSGLSNPYNSNVKGGSGGCTHYFNNVRHKYDPFTWPIMFDPIGNASWNDNNFDQYTEIVTEKFSSRNPHDLTGYIIDPLVSHLLLSSLIGTFAPTDEQVEDADAKFTEADDKSGEIIAKYKDLKNAADLYKFIKLVADFTTTD